LLCAICASIVAVLLAAGPATAYTPETPSWIWEALEKQPGVPPPPSGEHQAPESSSAAEPAQPAVEILTTEVVPNTHGWVKLGLSCAPESACGGALVLKSKSDRPGGGKALIFAERRYNLSAGKQRAIALKFRSEAPHSGERFTALATATVLGGETARKDVTIRGAS
jgi:hypothetical protein